MLKQCLLQSHLRGERFCRGCARGKNARLVIAFSIFLPFSGYAQDNVVANALTLLESGDLASAEAMLRAELAKQPNNVDALDVFGVVLDKEKKYQEADGVYLRAMGLAHPSPALLNNHANHLLATNKFEEAEEEFLRVIALEPNNSNARIHLAELALRDRHPLKAANSLKILPKNIRERPDVMLLRMRAAYQDGQKVEAESILTKLSQEAAHDADATIAIGSALFAAEQYNEAETLFAQAIELTHGGFQAVYYCGLAASRSGHNDHARELLDQALREQPTNVDVLYDLAIANTKLGNGETALELLGRAKRLTPGRPDLQELLARITAELGYFADSATAWDEYLRLVPADDSARRERAFVQTAIGDQAEAGIAALTAYMHKHPADAVGHYELATAEGPTNTDLALRELNRAIALSPKMTAPRFARGLLLQREGSAESALPDFEWAAMHAPKNAAILDRLGDAQLSLGRVEEAVSALRRAAELAPEDPTILNHLGRALRKSGQNEEAGAVFARLRELGPAKPGQSHPSGLLDFLSLSPEEQLLRYRVGVERTVKKNPENVQAQVRYLQLLLDDGDTERALSVVRRIASLKPSPTQAREAEQVLLSAQQYDAAKQFRADISGSKIE